MLIHDDDEKIEQVAKVGEEAFWTKVREEYPDRVTDERDSVTREQVSEGMRMAVKIWTLTNKTTLIS